jgi:hypothetical protein
VAAGGAGSQLTAGPLPDQADPGTVAAMHDNNAMKAQGTVVPVSISDPAS